MQVLQTRKYQTLWRLLDSIKEVSEIIGKVPKDQNETVTVGRLIFSQQGKFLTDRRKV